MNRLHRSKRNKVILGVCGGLAEYFNIDPTLVRIISILVAIPGPGILMYLVAALIMPEDSGYAGSNQWGSGFGSGSCTGTGNGTGAGANANTGSDTGSGADSGFNSDFESEFGSSSDEWGGPAEYHSEKNKTVLGTILVGLGILLLGKQIMPGLFDLKYLVPILLVVIGGVMVFRGRR